HTFSYLMGDLHSLCSCRKETSLFSVAACIFTGILTSPKLIVPFHIVCTIHSSLFLSLSYIHLFHPSMIILPRFQPSYKKGGNKMDVMKPIASQDIPTGSEWLYEVKYDGFRCVLHWEASGEIRLTSKNKKDLTAQFPEIVTYC